jgi:2-dehydro-3-deoxy-D-arabinonate dehydratase
VRAAQLREQETAVAGRRALGCWRRTSHRALPRRREYGKMNGQRSNKEPTRAMYLTRHQAAGGPRWAVDGHFLPPAFTLGFLLQLDRVDIQPLLASIPRPDAATGALLPPVEPDQEVWACGVTYLRSREAREAESTVADVYGRVYQAERPELFFKSIGWRVVGHQMPIRVRDDSRWNVPEPELTLVVNSRGQIVGYTAGNDVSSRDIEGENPLYLPQAKVYDGACAVGPGIRLVDPATLRDLPIVLSITRDGQNVFTGEVRTSQMKRTLEELAGYVCRETTFPSGTFVMTGTGIVPPHEFSMMRGDLVRITIGDLTLDNPVSTAPRAAAR